MVDGKIDGEVVVAYPSGILKSVKSFVQNVPVGTHTTYAETGEVVEVIRYEGGAAVEVTGELIDRGEDG